MVLGGEVLNVLRWCSRRATTCGARIRRADVQPFPAFLGHAVPVVSPAELQASAFTAAHLRGSVPVGWRAASSIAGRGRPPARAPASAFVYAYYGGIDKIAHERGFGEYYDAELRAADRLVGDVLERCPPARRCS